MRYEGVVEKGSQRATALGFPTINLPLTGPDSGVFAARVEVDDQVYEGAAFADEVRHVLEVHLLGVELDLYGKKVAIELVQKLRERQEFPDDASMRKAIAADVADARTYFAQK